MPKKRKHKNSNANANTNTDNAANNNAENSQDPGKEIPKAESANESQHPEQTDESPAKKRKTEKSKISGQATDMEIEEALSDASSSSSSSSSSSLEKKYTSESAHENYFFSANFEGMHTNEVRELGYTSVISSSHPDETLKAFLDKIVKQKRKDGRRQNSKDMVDSLCYYIMGSHGRFGFFGSRGDNRGTREVNLLGCFISEERWELADIAIDYLWKYMQACEQYNGRTREKLLAFIGKALVLKYCDKDKGSFYNDGKRDQPKPSVHCKLIKTFFERYKVDLNIETTDLHLESNLKQKSLYRANYNGTDPLIELLKDKQIRCEYIEVLLSFGRQLTEADFITFLKMYSQYNHEEAAKILKLIIEKVKVGDGILEFAFKKNLHKDMIMMLLNRGCKPNFSKDLLELRKSAIHYGLREIYEICCQKLEQQNPDYQKTLALDAHPIIVLLNSECFDASSLTWLSSLLSNHLKDVIDSPLFFQVFEHWMSNYVLSGRRNKILNRDPLNGYPIFGQNKKSGLVSVTQYDVESLSPEDTKQLTDLVQQVFVLMRANGNIYQTLVDKKIDSFEEYFIFSILQNSNRESKLLSEILKTVIPEEDEELKTYHERRGKLLSKVFQRFGMYPVAALEKCIEIFLQLINRGADPHRLLKDYIEVCLSGNIYEDAANKYYSFFNSPFIKSKLNSNALTKMLIGICGSKALFKSSIVPMLKMMVEIIKNPQGQGGGLSLNWDAIFASYLQNMPFRLSQALRELPVKLERAVKYNLEKPTFEKCEALELEGTQFLMQLNGARLPAAIIVNDNTYTAVEYVARINLTTHKPALLLQHEAFLNKTSYQNDMVLAKSQMVHRLFLEHIGISEIPKNHRFAIIDAMTKEMKRLKSISDHVVIPGVESQHSMQGRTNHIIKFLVAQIYDTLQQDIKKFFNQKYNGMPVDSLSMIAIAAVKNQEFVLDAKREHEIWALNSLRAYSFLHRITVLLNQQSIPNRKTWISLYINISIIFANLVAERGPMARLIDGLCMLDEQYHKLPPDNRNIDQEKFINYLYCLIKTLPSVNLPTFGGQALKDKVVEFYNQISSAASQGEEQKMMLDVPAENPVSSMNIFRHPALNIQFSSELIEKHKQEFYQSMESDITWGYISKKELEDIFAELSSTNTLVPLNNADNDLSMMLLQYSAMQTESDSCDDYLSNDASLYLNSNSNSSSSSSSSSNSKPLK